MGRVEGKVALVTGAASGLGKAAAQALVREGARVMVTDLREEEGQAVAESLGPSASFCRLDVTRAEDWQRAVDRTLERLGRLDVLVNNAGVGLAKDIESLTLEEWRLVHAVNLDGVFLGCQHGIRAMRRNEMGGSIINISSIAGLVGVPEFAAYGSAKAAVRQLTKSVALHCAKAGYRIRCNSVHPAFIETPMVEGLLRLSGDPERARERLRRRIPLGHLGQPEDIAMAVVYLASDESRLMTGAEMVLDGGATAQ